MAFAKASYDNETIELMGKAFDSVLGEMKAANVPLSPSSTSMVARRISEAVDSGERDLNWLILKGFETANIFRPVCITGRRRGTIRAPEPQVARQAKA